MTFLFEDPTYIWIVGAVVVTFAAVIWSQSASRAAFFGMIGAAILTLLCVAVEWLWVTPREEIRLTLGDVMESIEANDMPGVLSYLSPSATESRSLVEDLMPKLDIKKARVISGVEISLDSDENPKSAQATFRGLFQALHKSAGVQGAKPLEVEVTFVRDGERWLIESYTSPEDFRSQAAKLK